MKNEGNGTKLCKHCQTEIPEKAKVCPHCRKKQKGGVLKWVIIAILALGVIGAVTSGGEDDNTEQANKENIEVDTNGKENDEGQKEEQNELTVGSTFEKNGLKITVNDASLDFTDYSDDYNMYSPADGMKYIMVSFTFENSGDSDAYVSIYDFDCYADNAACEQAYLPDESDFINTNLSSGRNISFQTYYSVPTDAQSIELEYETNVWTGEKKIIKLQ